MSPLPAPASILPHRPPFLFVDQIHELTPGERAVGSWCPSEDEPFFSGHFPGRPTLPGVLQIEALAQVGAIAVLTHDVGAGRLPLFGGLNKARFRRQVEPGEELRLEVEMVRLSARGGRGHGIGTVDGVTTVEGELVFVLVDP